MQPAKSLPLVGIVILNWNKPDDTTACLESLDKLSYPSYEVVVVDNGSTDGSPALLRSRFPGLDLVENGANLGFAGGNNVGISHLLSRDVRYVMLLNDDTVVHPGLLSTLVEVAEARSDVGVVGPKIYYHQPGDVVWSAGGAIDKFGEPHHIGIDAVDAAESEAPREVDYVTGCAILVKREVIEKVGVLDERFFIYFEESEWCSRARRAGFRVVYVPRAIMWHKIQANERHYSRRYLYLMARNRLLYLRCIGASPWLILLAAVDMVRTSLSWLVKPEHREMRRFAAMQPRGICDFLIGRFGAPPVNL